MENWMHDTSSVGDKTAHLLSHTFTKATEDRIHGIIKGYIEDNPDKIQQLAGPWLKHKKTTISDYVDFIIKKGSKFDELTLMIFSIATKCHIGVINRDSSMWTTNESGDMEECEVLLLNRGNLMFESVEMIKVEKEDKEDRTAAEKEDLTYYPEDYPEEEDEYGGGDGDEEEEEDEEERDDDDNGGGDNGGGGDDDEKEHGPASLIVAVVPPMQKQTPKKQPIVEFSTLTRSAWKRQKEQMMRDVESEMELNRKKEEGTKTSESTSSAPVKGVLVKEGGEAPVKSTVEGASGAPIMTQPEGAPLMTQPKGAPVTTEPEGVSVTTESEGALVKSIVEGVFGVPVTTEPKGAPITTESEGVPVTTEPKSAPVKPVKGASRSEPVHPGRVPENLRGKSGGKGGKPKSSSKKVTEEEKEGGSRVTRAMQKKLDEEEEEKKKEKKKEKKEKKDKKKKKKEKKVKTEVKKEKKEEKREGKPVEKKPKIELKIEDIDIKPKIEEVEAKVKLSTGKFEVKTIGLKKRRAKKYRCRICKDIINTISERNRHMAEKHDLNEFECRQCDQEFEMENSLKRYEKVHVEGVKLLKCEKCEQTFLHESQRKWHMLTHTESVQYHCPSKDCE